MCDSTEMLLGLLRTYVRPYRSLIAIVASLQVISTLASCVAEGEQDLYTPVTVREHIAAKLAGSRAGRINTSTPRDAARILPSG